MNILKSTQNYFAAVVAVVALFGLAAAGSISPVSAAQDGANNQPAQQNQNNDQNTYVYTAQPGDSYTLMARKAVQTYGILNNVNLTQAQIIAAETNLTQAAGFPLLNEGQRVEFTAANVRSAVESAQKLTAEQQAEWQVYVPHVDFNTNAVGEARS